MDEISEFLYQTFAVVLICIGLSVVILLQNNLSGVQEIIKTREEKISYSKYGFGSCESGAIVSGDRVRAYIMSKQGCNIYIDNKKTVTDNMNITGCLSSADADMYYVDYRFDETGRVDTVFFTRVGYTQHINSNSDS